MGERKFVVSDWTPMWGPYLNHYEPKKHVIKEWLTSTSFAEDISSIFYECDKDGNHMLEWNNGEIRNFITKLYQRKGLPIPGEFTMYSMYNEFDEDKNGGLDAVEAQHLAQGHVMSLCAALNQPNKNQGHVFVHPHTKVERKFVVADWTPMWGPNLVH